MVERTVIINEITIEELRDEITIAIKSELSTLLKDYKFEKPDELITSKEVAKILGVSLVTLYSYRKKGIITAYRLGRIVRYKKSEVMNLENVR